MSDIDELQRRISAALDRVSAGLEGLGAAGADTTAELQAALDDEKTANAQLEERLRTLKDRHASELDALRDQAASMQAQVSVLDVEMQKLKQANQQLRDANIALRTANEKGVGEPHLINKSMLAELEALRAARSAETAEASAILSAMAPLLEAGTSDQEGATNA